MKCLTSSGASDVLWGLPTATYWKMLLAFLKLFLMTHIIKSLCLSDKRTTVVRRAVQCIAQVYPGRPQALICNSVSALFSPSSMDTDGRVSFSKLLTGPIKTWKTKAFISSVLTTVPTVLLMPHFSLNFPYREYFSPERNQISFRAYDFSLLEKGIAHFGKGKMKPFLPFL
uniref:Uncharacterized protein n=1 Tax=Molossus molossus TaxID=27622 RepID=A0A7J8EEA9_MOLMO|nr:hypothetical protein HJG59_008918 [Molossus molossus]